MGSPINFLASERLKRHIKGVTINAFFGISSRAARGHDGVRWVDAFPWLARALKKPSATFDRPIQVNDPDFSSSVFDVVNAVEHSWLPLTLSELFPYVPLDYRLTEIKFVDVNPVGTLANNLDEFDAVAELTPTQLNDEIGIRSVDALLTHLVEQNARRAIAAATEEDASDQHREPAPAIPTASQAIDAFAAFEKVAEAEVSAIDAIDVVAQWAYRNADRNRALFTVADFGAEFIPHDVRLAIEALERLTPSSWVQPAGTPFSAKDFIASFVSELSDRDLRILVARKLSQPPVTLDAVGAEFGVTRERIRQLEGPLFAAVSEWFESNGDAMALSARIRQHVGKVGSLEALLASFPELASSVDELNLPTWFVFDQFDDSFESDGTWVAVPSIHEVGTEFDSLFDEFVRDEGYVELDELRSLLGTWGEQSFDVILDWAQTRGYSRIGGVMVSREVRSMNSLAVVALSLEGKPMPENELHKLVAPDRSLRSFSNQLASDPRAIRSGAGMWALKSWGGHEYAGIREEIIRRVDAGGLVLLSDLLAELPGKFSVAPSSVHTYATTWPLRTVHNVVSRATTPVAPARPVNRSRGVSFIDGGFAYRFAVSADHLRGSGFQFPAPLAGALGITQGSERTFEPTGAEKPVTVRWRQMQPQASSIRPNLIELDARLGDIVTITFVGNRSNVIDLGPLSDDPTEAIRQLLAMDDLAPVTSETVARALGLKASSPWHEIRNLALLRHEDDLLAAIDALPGSHKDESE
jgi:hypothetical protein